MVSSEKFSAKLSAFEAELNARSGILYKDSSRLHEACRYALAGQGKRIRPLLLLSAAEACGADWRKALIPALSVEFVHTYSLVHDDLPCMDDDDLRRGRPTTHKVFDEATALLAGDALLTDGISLLLQTADLDAKAILALVQTLTRAAGGQGMVYGQDLDMHWTGRDGYSAQDLDAIHNHKTGALIAAACEMGGITASASADQLDALKKFGHIIGLTFQIIDDLLDDSTQTGKSQGKDQHSGKLTYLSLMNRDEALRRSRELTQMALAQLDRFGAPAEDLKHLAQVLLQRQS